MALEELRMAAAVGCERQLRAMRGNYSPGHGLKPAPVNDWGISICGAAAELFVAKSLDLFWCDRPALDYDGDVGPYHVRWTPYVSGHLTIHAPDPEDAPFVLVTGTPPQLAIRGWTFAHVAQQKRYWSDLGGDGRWAFNLPISDLQPMVELPTIHELQL